MSKNNNDGKLEYYEAKQSVGQVPVKKRETTRTPISSSKGGELQPNSDGYIAMSQTSELQREFERYEEITFAQKASEKAKQNPFIP